ncbi:hypothetical protein COV53_03530 [Candidatus Gottesmanbacteria bacterium CG11_big_fil_rev_8_21_14_0_20_37_11]|uniref:Anaphase-promoting complex subunit 4 WD40 domain-containing protein n=3 Tax=Candidatus Gottesmaniibacteriota TaxID=1752720 RepID=A0A2M7RR28_9BACT|nr:MAG: hypothetical protein AUJ73_03515 [Candidatus Gottesmanbacteria bacterium CG1_02_37_22]PIP33269.1 MAG: hypothetical protein COX23_00225 [Candidatus Gottesmanbacteria bacterium CG23_combo_of_CG06-09_8_20_14_all_37_19]PIR08333.1 MAG: hypothetical protein COV53_03530 [Candidatus Gottesmanbacteria bacterium CG11_big_fil_rev_8_21_14_0_20_37_11]PIZ02753.1 MAG: hypothetical protein COY59_03040 [Candidatus Gottesmanbacteria bacterium CG_4_10_14_0_8_um_filter_37_24]
MDENPAQGYNSDTNNTEGSYSQGVPFGTIASTSHLKKFLPVFILFALIIMVGSGYALFSRKSEIKPPPTIPTLRPTATPFLIPTLPMTSPGEASLSASVTPQAITVTPVKIGRLAFIKDGDIYNSDLLTISLLVKNATPAATKLSWSPKGNYLSWTVKEKEASPSALAVYSRSTNRTIIFDPSDGRKAELIDYTWSLDEEKIALLYQDSLYKISLYSPASPAAEFKIDLTKKDVSIRQIFWLDKNSVLFAGDEGIKTISLNAPFAETVLTDKKPYFVSLSPDKTKIIYSLGDNKKSDLYLASTDGILNQVLPAMPEKIDMGDTKLTTTILKEGFVPYVVWFPKGDRLLVGYHYLTGLPLVGVYSLVDKSFKAIAPFSFYDSDKMIDELRLMGERINDMGSPSFPQVSVFTMEDDAKLGTIRVIPGASSPVFFGD